MRRLAVMGYRLRVKGLLVLSIFIFHFSICLAQSNLTYELKVGATGEVKVLQEFPESCRREDQYNG